MIMRPVGDPARDFLPEASKNALRLRVVRSTGMATHSSVTERMARTNRMADYSDGDGDAERGCKIEWGWRSFEGVAACDTAPYSGSGFDGGELAC